MKNYIKKITHQKYDILLAKNGATGGCYNDRR